MNWIKVTIFISCLISTLSGSPVNIDIGKGQDSQDGSYSERLEYSLKVNIISVTNPDEFLEAGAGAGGQVKLGLNVTGPFVYDVKISKRDAVSNQNGTITFKTKKTYAFNLEKSVEAEDKTRFTVPNVPYLSLITAKSTGIGEHEDQLEDFLISASNAEPFVQKTVQELLWGYEDPLLKLLQEKGLRQIGKWGLFLDDNEDNMESILTVASSFLKKTDEDKQKKLQVSSYDTIHLVNGQTQFNTWANEYCNQINGTDFMDPHVRLNPSSNSFYFLNSKICRPFKFTFESNLTSETGNLLRYAADKEFFGGIQDYPNNHCFCQTYGTDNEPQECPLRGTLDLSKCKSDTNGIIISWPYFNHADESTTEKFANDFHDEHHEKESDQFLELDVASGIVKGLKLSIQWNVQMKMNVEIPQALNFTNILIPLIQTTDSIELAPSHSHSHQANDNDRSYQNLDERSGRQASEPLALNDKVKEVKKVVKAVKSLKKQKKKKSSAISRNGNSHWMTIITVLATAKLLSAL